MAQQAVTQVVNPHILAASQQAAISPSIWTTIIAILHGLGGVGGVWGQLAAAIAGLLELLIGNANPPTPTPAPNPGPIVVTHPALLAATTQAGLPPAIWQTIIGILSGMGGLGGIIARLLGILIAHGGLPTPAAAAPTGSVP